MASLGSLPVDSLPLIMFLIYLGAVGKSAQFPLHVAARRDGGAHAGLRADPRRTMVWPACSW